MNYIPNYVTSQLTNCYYRGSGCYFAKGMSWYCIECGYYFCDLHLNTHGHALEIPVSSKCEKCSRSAMKNSKRCSFHGYAGIIKSNGITIYDGR